MPNLIIKIFKIIYIILGLLFLCASIGSIIMFLKPELFFLMSGPGVLSFIIVHGLDKKKIFVLKFIIALHILIGATVIIFAIMFSRLPCNPTFYLKFFIFLTMATVLPLWIFTQPSIKGEFQNN